MKYRLVFTTLCITPFLLSAAASSSSSAAPSTAVSSSDENLTDPETYVHVYMSLKKTKELHFQGGALFFGPSNQNLAAWCIAGPHEQSVQLFHRYMQHHAQFTTGDKKKILQNAFERLKSSLPAKELDNPRAFSIQVALILNCIGMWGQSHFATQAEFNNTTSNFSCSSDWGAGEGRWISYLPWKRDDYIPLNIIKFRRINDDDRELKKKIANLSNVIELIKRRKFDEAGPAFFNATQNLSGVLIVDLARLQAYRELSPSQSLSMPELPAGCTVSCVLQ